MNFKERIELAKEQERIAQIKLENNKIYNVEVVEALYTKQKTTNYDCVQLTLKVLDNEVAGKLINRVLVIDENTKNKLQGVIGLQTLIKILNHFNLHFEDDKSLVLALLDLKGKHLKVKLEITPSKHDLTKTYNNYTFIFE